MFSSSDDNNNINIPTDGIEDVINIHNNNLQGLTGFHATAPAKSISIDDLVKPAIGPGRADAILNTPLPSLYQFLSANQADSLLSI